AENTATVAEVCKRLDGLPLAIELAAARTRAVPAGALLQMLESTSGGLPILTGGPRGVPERQRTLRSTIAWSYDLLPADEPALFSSDRMRLVNQLEREHANWRSALDWCLEQGYANPSLRLAIGLATYWLLAGHVAEGRARSAKLLTRFPPPGAASPRAILY